MVILSAEDKEYLRREFEKSLVDPVEILFLKDENCKFCSQISELLKELSSLSEKIKIVKKDLKEVKGKIRLPREINSAPIILFNNNGNYNFGFAGTPSGHEFSAFINDIISLSSKKLQINKDQIEKLKNVVKDNDIEILIFVTPTCPYCSKQVFLAHQFSLALPSLRSFMVEAYEFQELANKYNVFSVPKTVIFVNGENKGEYEGPVPQTYFVDQILLAVEI